MAKLNMIPGRDFNFIFAGSEKLFLRGFKELDTFQLLLSKFEEPVNGGKKFLVTFSGDGKFHKVSFLGKRRYAEELELSAKNKSDELARMNIEKHREQGGFVDDGGFYYDDEYSYGDESQLDTLDDDSDAEASTEDDEESMVYIDNIVSNVDYLSAINRLVAIMNTHQDAIIVLDSDIITGADNPADVNWLIHFFNSVKERKWTEDNRRTTVLILFENDSCLEEFEFRMGGKGRPEFLFANVPELTSMSAGQSLKIMPPNIEDLRNLMFKRLLCYRPDELYRLDAFTTLLNQAVSESNRTGCRTLTQIDNAIRYMIGSGDLSMEHLKRILFLDKIKKKKTWESLKGKSAARIHKEFETIKKSLTANTDEKNHENEIPDPSYYHRTDVSKKQTRLNGLPHFTLMGEPGTGKTTMANIMADEFYQMGAIKSNCPVIVNLGERLSNPDLSWIHNLFDIEGRDRLIFIDEIESAMKSAKGDWGEDSSSSGDSQLASALQMFVTKLLSVTTDGDTNTIVCLAGYTRGVVEFLHLDKGLLSRFPNKFVLEGYDGDVLYSIMKGYLKEYGQSVDPSLDAIMPNMFTDLRAGLTYEDSDGWANARTAETIGEKVHQASPKKNVLEKSDFEKVNLDIGSNTYCLAHYIGRGNENELEELGHIPGTEKLVTQLQRFEKRHSAKLPLPAKRNIALICDIQGSRINNILRILGRFFSKVGVTSRPLIHEFNYSATLSHWSNRPIVLTENQFDMADGSLLVFRSPSDHLKEDTTERGSYAEQTRVIIRKSKEISRRDSKTAMVVIESPQGWMKLRRNLMYFTTLFNECVYAVNDVEGKVSTIIDELNAMNVKFDDSFASSLKEGLGSHTLRDIDEALDDLLMSTEGWDKGGRELTREDAPYFYKSESEPDTDLKGEEQ